MNKQDKILEISDLFSVNDDAMEEFMEAILHDSWIDQEIWMNEERKIMGGRDERERIKG